MKKMCKCFTRAFAIMLVVILLLTSLMSCKARPLGQTKLAGKDVGTVGEYTVDYEEFYFLAHNYYLSVKDDYQNDPEGLRKAVWDYVKENITANYAVLELCKTLDIVYDEDELKDEVKDSVELYIETEFNGSRNEYLDALKALGLTDHYVRFTMGVDILYERLAVKYLEDGIVPNTDEELMSYMKDNFVHTWHIAIFVDSEDDRVAELAKAEEALSKLESGEMSMLDLMGSKYNEDFTIPHTKYDGHYFPHGIMEKWYEDAAFALEVGKHTDVITAMGENNNGEYVECFYIIERLPSSEEEIDSNFIELSDTVTDSLIYEDVEAIKATLSFEPNEYALSLDVTSLEQPRNGADTQMILVIVLCVLCCACIVTLIFIVRYIKKKRFRATLKK